MRVSLTEQRGEIKGNIQTTGHGAFHLECLAQIVEAIAKTSGVPADEVVRDLYAVVTGRVK